MDREAVRLYLLCFVHDRYQRLNDNLLGAFCSLVRRYVEEVDAATKEAIYRVLPAVVRGSGSSQHYDVR